MSTALVEALEAARREVHLLTRERLRSLARFEEQEILVRRLQARIAELEAAAKGKS